VIETVVRETAPQEPADDASTAAAIAAPRAAQPERLPPPPTDPAADPLAGRKLRLLLAEDNPVNRTIGTRMLGKFGHVVVAVENGAAAVEITGTERFDVVLMDVEMPVMNGFEAARLLRESRPRTCVLMVSGADDVLAHGARLAAHAVVEKSDLNALICAVARLGANCP
jgi:CheY-like chemotaxis protein